MPEKDNKPGLLLPPDVAPGRFADQMIITHTDEIFIIDFLSNLPGMPAPAVQSRVIVTPKTAKSILLALQENISKYEAKNGAIPLPQHQNTFTIPVDVNNKS